MKKICSLIIIALCFIFFNPITLNASTSNPLDEIQDYKITVNTRNDGSLDIKINIIWKVLDSTSEGPLEWVKIGVPNYHCDEITSLSSNISDIDYYSNNGSYVRIDFDKNYYINEIVNFSFSFHQAYMYKIDDTETIVTYSYTPGWFEEINVLNYDLYWNNTDVLEANTNDISNNYLHMSGSMSMNQKVTINVKYNISAFPNIDLGKQYTEDYSEPLTDKEIVIIICMLLFFIFVVTCAFLGARNADPYSAGRGFSGVNTFYYFRMYQHLDRQGNEIKEPTPSGTGVSHGGGGSCACACACACAGGGRAGCSRKDFYNTDLKTNDVNKAIDNFIDKENNKK